MTDHDREASNALERISQLTKREREVLLLLANGLSNNQIAKQLRLSGQTVKFHVSNILSKLRLESRLQAGVAACLLIPGDTEVQRYSPGRPPNGAVPRSSTED